MNLNNMCTERKRYKKVLFNIDTEDPIQGYTDGTTWNGWECPLFTKEEANKIISYFAENEIKAYFDIIGDTYYIKIDNTLEAYKGVDIVYNGEKIHVYCIGSNCLCWTKIE